MYTRFPKTLLAPLELSPLPGKRLCFFLSPVTLLLTLPWSFSFRLGSLCSLLFTFSHCTKGLMVNPCGGGGGEKQNIQKPHTGDKRKLKNKTAPLLETLKCYSKGRPPSTNGALPIIYLATKISGGGGENQQHKNTFILSLLVALPLRWVQHSQWEWLALIPQGYHGQC